MIIMCSVMPFYRQSLQCHLGNFSAAFLVICAHLQWYHCLQLLHSTHGVLPVALLYVQTELGHISLANGKKI